MTELEKSSLDFIQPPHPVISFVKSQKGKSMILINGYTFKLNKITTNQVIHNLCYNVKFISYNT